MTTRTDAELGREAQLELQRNSVVKELSRVIRQRDALLAACREALAVFNGPNYGGAPGTTLAVHSIRAAIAACEEKPE